MNRIFALAAALLIGASPAAAAPVGIVAAENFYGDVARQIGGDEVAVRSLVSSPDQDPHLFEASPSAARDLAGAKIVIFSGADYDPWIEKLLAAHKAPGRREIDVARLVRVKSGENPHVWYDPTTMKTLARKLEADLSDIDPAHKADYDRRTAAFLDSLKPIELKIAEMKAKYAGVPVTATEPVFGYLAQALGLKMRNEKFQLAIQNNAEPSVSDVAAFESDLKGRKVKALIYNAQASEPAVKKLLDLAEKQGIAIVPITETQPPGKTYPEWMLAQLDALDKALEKTLAGAPK